MTIKVIKIDGEFAIVELENREKRVCPVEIFPKKIVVGDFVRICIDENDGECIDLHSRNKNRG